MAQLCTAMTMEPPVLGSAQSRRDLAVEVLERARGGDAAAQRILIRRYQGPIGALLGRMLSPAGLHGLVDDLAQETFIRAIQALPRFDPDGPARFSTWLFRIASRLAINELQRKRPTSAGGTAAVDALASARGADESERRRRIGTAIRDAVSELLPEFRAAFLMREYHGLEYAEIAEALELDLGTVKSRLFRARRELRARLEEVRDE